MADIAQRLQALKKIYTEPPRKPKGFCPHCGIHRRAQPPSSPARENPPFACASTDSWQSPECEARVEIMYLTWERDTCIAALEKIAEGEHLDADDLRHIAADAIRPVPEFSVE